jgi:hypothetical protein
MGRQGTAEARHFRPGLRAHSAGDWAEREPDLQTHPDKSAPARPPGHTVVAVYWWPWFSPYPLHDPGAAQDSAVGSKDSASQGELLVPLDAWQRMLDQLGHLHEGGERLAQAEARAAKAETKVEFLAEQVRELKAEREELKGRIEVRNERLDDMKEPEPERSRRRWWARVQFWRGLVPSN